MKNLKLAIRTLQYVKSRMPLDQADNKGVRRDLMSQDKEVQTAYGLKRAAMQSKLNSMREHHRFPAAGGGIESAQNAVLYGAFAIAAGFGNCLERACATAWYLNDQGLFNYDLVYYTGKPGPREGVNDHIFVVIGQQSGGDGIFPTDFGAWDPGAAICDAWADIACLASDYPARWRARMDNWYANGMVIANRMPTDTMWKDVVDKTKSSYFGAEEAEAVEQSIDLSRFPSGAKTNTQNANDDMLRHLQGMVNAFSHQVQRIDELAEKVDALNEANMVHHRDHPRRPSPAPPTHTTSGTNVVFWT